jgi:hypothetical protein
MQLRIGGTDEPLDDHDFTLAFALGLYRFHLHYGIDFPVQIVFDGEEMTGWSIEGDPMDIFTVMELEYLDTGLLEQLFGSGNDE